MEEAGEAPGVTGADASRLFWQEVAGIRRLISKGPEWREVSKKPCWNHDAHHDLGRLGDTHDVLRAMVWLG